ncbi:MAG TPA: STN domain-containing protein [Methylovirgula sp.]|nr:STN domain-containing protein [Methylovirgula sp.]
MTFDIPAQPLAAALQSYGEKTGLQVLYESRSALGRMSTKVEGMFSRDAALALLLKGTGLQVRYTSENAITLALPSERKAGVGSPQALPAPNLILGTMPVRDEAEPEDASQLRDYSASIQLDIRSALQRNALTRAGSYHFIARLWIDPSRAVQRAELSLPTGDEARDAAIVTTLQGLVMSRTAPENTPQPVRIAVTVRSLQ